ncbi:MAG: diiron oxygenase [Candidatus Binatia bacterium]
MRTRELINLTNSGHPGINALFSKAHAAGWDIDRDVDWSLPIAADDPLVDHAWAAFGATPTFRALPETVQTYATRRALGRMLNVLQVGESVAQDVCAQLVLRLREEDYRNHAAAQAMDEARHHLAYRRILEKMNEEPEDLDPGTELMFDSLLAAQGALELVATEQFFLESVAMDIFDGIRAHATHPLLRQVLPLVVRDESRHMGFGVLYVAEHLRRHDRDARVDFARRWMGQILFAATDQPGPIMLGRLLRRLREAGVDADALAPALLSEQQAINARARDEALAGRRLPQLMKSARRAGLLQPDLLEALGIAQHPLVRATLAAEVGGIAEG